MSALHTNACKHTARILLVFILGCSDPAGEPVQSSGAVDTGTHGAITFYLPYESTVATPEIAGGLSRPNVSDPILQAPGLFGQAARSETKKIAWPKANNIDLSQPGSVAFWLKPIPNQWDDSWIFNAIDGSRKLMVYNRNGSLFARMEEWGGAHAVEVTQGDISTWSTTDNSWHLVVASWGSDSVGLSLDGAPTQTTSASWLSAIPCGANGWLYGGGGKYPGYLFDELIVFNRTVSAGEITWMWGTRSTPTSPNPAIAKFGVSGERSGKLP